VIFLKERPDKSAVFLSVMAIAGAMMMLYDPKVGYPRLNDWIDLFAISSGISFSIANVLIRHLQGSSLASKTFVSFLGVVAISIAGILIMGQEVPQTNVYALSGNLLLGLAGMFVMALTVYYGVTHLPIYQSAVILLFEVIVTVVSAHFLDTPRMTVAAWCGGALIFVSALTTAVMMKRIPDQNYDESYEESYKENQ
jgi:drug/metabolite transporter (DMT)-like permease